MASSRDPQPRARRETLLLERIAGGEQSLTGELLELLYGELHDLAARIIGGGDAAATRCSQRPS